MGNGVSTAAADHKFAFSVVSAEYERLKEVLERDHIELDDSDIHNMLTVLYNKALAQFELPFCECKTAGVLAAKYKLLSVEEQQAYETELMDAINAKEKKEKLANDAIAKKKGNYEKSTSGTAEDTKNEAEAAKLLRGDNGDTGDAGPAMLKYDVSIYDHPIQEKTLNLVGKWKKFLGLSKNCYLYIHVISKEVVSIRPMEYDEGDKGAQETEEISTDPRIANPSNNLPTCNLTNLVDSIDAIVAQEKTPFLIETSPDQFLAAYFTYKAILFDVSVLIVPYAKGGPKRETLMEDGRAKLVLAMKTGVPFVLYLGHVTIEHADFKAKLCKKEVFPTDVFQQAGMKLKGPAHAPRYKALFKPDELVAGQAIIKDGFHVMVLTALSAYDYEEKLSASIPLGYMSPLYVEKE